MVQVTNMTPGSASQPYVLGQNKCVMLALIHDLAEAIVGDITPDDPVTKAGLVGTFHHVLCTVKINTSS